MSWAVLIKPLEEVKQLWVAEIVDRDDEKVVLGAWIPEPAFDNEIEAAHYYEDWEFQDVDKTDPSDLIPERWNHKIVPVSYIKEFDSKEAAETWVKKVRIAK